MFTKKNCFDAEPKEEPKEEVLRKEPWIVQGLTNLVPKIPRRSTVQNLDDPDSDLGFDLKPGESHPDLTEREKDYREWLAESEQLHHGAHLNLEAEIETDEEDEENGGIRTPSN